MASRARHRRQRDPLHLVEAPSGRDAVDAGASGTPVDPSAGMARVPIGSAVRTAPPSPYIKQCPGCGADLFDDMDICYECLYGYNNPNPEYVGPGVRMDSLEEVPMDEPMPPVVPPVNPLPSEVGEGDASASDPLLPSVPESFTDGDAGSWSSDSEMDEFEPEERIEPVEASEAEVESEDGPIVSPSEPPPAAEETTVMEPDEINGAEEDDVKVDRRQDVGLFSEAVAPDTSESSSRTPSRCGIQLGVLVHCEALETTTAFRDGRVTIGRDKASDIVLHDFAAPAQVGVIEPAGDGAELTLLAEAVDARLDGDPIDRAAHFGAGQEIDLFNIRLSLVRLD